MRQLIKIANSLDDEGFFEIADGLDRILAAMKSQEDVELEKADKIALDYMKEALETRQIPEHLAEQMKQWILSKERGSN